MKTIDIHGANYSGCTNYIRAGSRGVIVCDGKILLSHETAIHQYMVPGGGIEEGETPEQACVRELCEETGLVVEPGECFLKLNEYYEDWLFVSYYFLCTPVGKGQIRLTEREQQVGAQPAWVPMQTALDVFAHYTKWDGIDEMRRGMYQREYTALTEYLSMVAERSSAEHYGWVDAQLMAKPGVRKDFQPIWKWMRYMIEDKLVAALCYDDNNQLVYLTVKLPPMESEFLRSQYADIIPGYYMNKLHWNSVRADGDVPQEVIANMLDHAWACVLSGFSKIRQKKILQKASDCTDTLC